MWSENEGILTLGCMYIPGPSMDADCIDLVAWASSSTIINEDECKNNENNTLTVKISESTRHVCK